MACLPMQFSYSFWSYVEVPQPQPEIPIGLACSPFARRYLGNLVLISLPSGTEMVQFPPFAFYGYFTHHRIIGLLLQGFPIRKHTGHRLFGSSPYSFAAFYVLHRHHVPRHPPRTLSRLSPFHLSKPILRLPKESFV